MDNGQELASRALTAGCEGRRIHPRYIRPGKPSQGAFIERFNLTYRTEILDLDVFASPVGVCEVTVAWRYRLNTPRPRHCPGSVPPLNYRPTAIAHLGSISEWPT